MQRPHRYITSPVLPFSMMIDIKNAKQLHVLIGFCMCNLAPGLENKAQSALQAVSPNLKRNLKHASKTNKQQQKAI